MCFFFFKKFLLDPPRIPLGISPWNGGFLIISIRTILETHDKIFLKIFKKVYPFTPDITSGIPSEIHLGL